MPVVYIYDCNGTGSKTVEELLLALLIGINSFVILEMLVSQIGENSCLNSKPATLSCSDPMELISIKQYLHPEATISCKSALMVIGSGVVLIVS